MTGVETYQLSKSVVIQTVVRQNLDQTHEFARLTKSTLPLRKGRVKEWGDLMLITIDKRDLDISNLQTFC